MKYRIRQISTGLLLAAVLFSCKKKDPENIGLPFVPGSDLLNAAFTDTLTLITHTVKDDSLRTDEVIPILLGVVNDPIFGVTNSSLYTQFSLSKSNPTFGTNPVLDSAVLSLVIYNKQYYGSVSAQQKFDVYELSEKIYRDSAYYSHSHSPYYTTQIIGSVTTAPNVKDSVSVDTLRFPPHLRIPLSKEMFQHFLDDPLYTSSYNSNANFQNIFKGIYIKSSVTPPSGQGAILYIDLAHVYTRLTLYYKNDTEDSLYHHFSIAKDACARFSHFDHDYSSAPAITAQLNASSSVQEANVFVQPMAGVRTKLTMPGITTLFGGKKVAINKAELILPAVTSTIDSVFPAHTKLVATIADSAKGPMIMPDYYEGATYFGGDFDNSKKEYRFNIARYVQQVVNGTRGNNGLYIITNARPTTAGRVQLWGGDKTNPTRIRLKITYTFLD